MTRKYPLAILLSLVLAVVVYAGQRGARNGVGKLPGVASDVPAPPPELERAQIQNDMTKLQLIQSQVQVLNYQFEQTKVGLQQKLKALERPGYDLNLETWTYVPKPK
jgi:hypothetical protein